MCSVPTSVRSRGTFDTNYKNREIQAARDIERDTLTVNGILVIGREGYSAVVARVKREFERLANPITGAEWSGFPVGASVATPRAHAGVAGSKTGEVCAQRKSSKM